MYVFIIAFHFITLIICCLFVSIESEGNDLEYMMGKFRVAAEEVKRQVKKRKREDVLEVPPRKQLCSHNIAVGK